MNSENNRTGVVHALSGKKVGPLELYETICEKSTGLFWLKADEKPITCTKCKSIIAGKKNTARVAQSG